MIEPKLMLHSPVWRAQLDDVQLPETPPSLRTAGFAYFAACVLGMFATCPALAGVKLVAVNRPELDNTVNTTVVLRRHLRLDLESTDADVATRLGLQTVEDRDGFLMDALPWKKMANGMAHVLRSDALVERYLRADETDSTPLVRELAERLDAGFGTVFVIDDFGTASLG